MSIQCTPPPSGAGPAGPVAGSAAGSQARSSPQPAESSPAEPSADYRLRGDSSLPSREPPRNNYCYPPSRESPPTDYCPPSGEPPRNNYCYPPSRESPPTDYCPPSGEPPSGGQGGYRSQGRRDWPPPVCRGRLVSMGELVGIPFSGNLRAMRRRATGVRVSVWMF